MATTKKQVDGLRTERTEISETIANMVAMQKRVSDLNLDSGVIQAVIWHTLNHLEAVLEAIEEELAETEMEG